MTENPDDENRDSSIPLGNVFETLSELLDALEDVDTDEQTSGRVTRGDATLAYMSLIHLCPCRRTG